jgi:hypothetical protein
MAGTDPLNYVEIYNLEDYLFGKVAKEFEETGNIGLIDFYMIIVWKAPRAKGYARARLACIGNGDATKAMRDISKALCDSKEPKDRLKVLIERGFRLATATAVLTVLDPFHFSVYDGRVCEQLRNLHLGDFDKLSNMKFLDDLWDGYQRFLKAVKDAVPWVHNLRDKDRYLWGKSFYEGCEKELGCGAA